MFSFVGWGSRTRTFFSLFYHLVHPAERKAVLRNSEPKPSEGARSNPESCCKMGFWSNIRTLNSVEWPTYTTDPCLFFLPMSVDNEENSPHKKHFHFTRHFLKLGLDLSPLPLRTLPCSLLDLTVPVWNETFLFFFIIKLLLFLFKPMQNNLNAMEYILHDQVIKVIEPYYPENVYNGATTVPLYSL